MNEIVHHFFVQPCSNIQQEISKAQARNSCQEYTEPQQESVVFAQESAKLTQESVTFVHEPAEPNKETANNWFTYAVSHVKQMTFQ